MSTKEITLEEIEKKYRMSGYETQILGHKVLVRVTISDDIKAEMYIRIKENDPIPVLIKYPGEDFKYILDPLNVQGHAATCRKLYKELQERVSEEEPEDSLNSFIKSQIENGIIKIEDGMFVIGNSVVPMKTGRAYLNSIIRDENVVLHKLRNDILDILHQFISIGGYEEKSVDLIHFTIGDFNFVLIIRDKFFTVDSAAFKHRQYFRDIKEFEKMIKLLNVLWTTYHEGNINEFAALALIVTKESIDFFDDIVISEGYAQYHRVRVPLDYTTPFTMLKSSRRFVSICKSAYNGTLMLHGYNADVHEFICE